MYDVYIDDMLLPVAPEKIPVKINGKSETVNLISEGEISILKSPGLTTANFTILLPNVKYPFAKYADGFHKANYYLDKLEKLKLNKRSFQFIIARMFPTETNVVKLFSTNLTVSLEDYQIIDDAKNGFDIEVQINLKQYKDYGTKTFTVTTPSQTAPMVVITSRSSSSKKDKSKKGGGKGKGKGGSKTYKVCVPGMSTLSVKASSVQDAIYKGVGKTWTGEVVVDGKTYYVVKGKISEKPAKKVDVPKTVKKAVQVVSNTVKAAANLVTNVISKITSSVGRTQTKVEKPAQKNLSGKLMLKK